MRVCVVGCGAVGSLFAANLAQLDDVEVWAFDVSRAHVDAINANGLRLVGAGEGAFNAFFVGRNNTDRYVRAESVDDAVDYGRVYACEVIIIVGPLIVFRISRVSGQRIGSGFLNERGGSAAAVARRQSSTRPAVIIKTHGPREG